MLKLICSKFKKPRRPPLCQQKNSRKKIGNPSIKKKISSRNLKNIKQIRANFIYSDSAHCRYIS